MAFPLGGVGTLLHHDTITTQNYEISLFVANQPSKLYITGESRKSLRLYIIVIPIFKPEFLIYHSKDNLHEKILFGKITHHLNPDIRKMLVKSMFGNEDSKFHSGP